MNAKKYTDKEIIEAIRSGGTQCEAMMAYLYPRYVNQIIAFVRERGGTEAEAEDIYQDAIVNLLLAIQDGRFEGRSAVSTYLFAISKICGTVVFVAIIWKMTTGQHCQGMSKMPIPPKYCS